MGPCSLILASRPEDHRLSQTLVSSHQLERKAKQMSAVKPLSLPKAKAQMKPGQVCSLAGWGKVALGTPATTLQEAELTVQKDRVCKSLYPRHYSRATQNCVGDPRKVKTGFKVSFLHLSTQTREVWVGQRPYPQLRISAAWSLNPMFCFSFP